MDGPCPWPRPGDCARACLALGAALCSSDPDVLHPVPDAVAWYGNFILAHFSRSAMLCNTLHASRAVICLVPRLIGCVLIGAYNPML